VQISVQDVTAEASDRIAGRHSFERKLEVGAWVKDLGMPLTLNIVLHRANLDRVAEVVALAERMNADRLEPGMRFTGPAIVEDPGMTVVVHPGNPVSVDAYGNLHIEVTG